MNKTSKLLLLTAFILMFCVNTGYSAETYKFAVTDMTWAEFYAGEVNKSSADLYSAGLDAISSPTSRVAYRFTQLTSESNDIGGRSITGVKDVQVRMTNDVYELFKDDERYTFVDEEFTEFKVVSTDGSFGKMSSDVTVASGASVSVTAPGTWGDYVLGIGNVDVTLGSGDTRYYLGALIETSDGSVYGMRHNNNLWFSANDMAVSVKEFVEVHGVSRNYRYTADMAGKTVTSITYMLKNRPDVVINCNALLKPQTTATVTAPSTAIKSGSNIAVGFTFANVPSDAGYSLSSVTYIPEGGNRRNRQTLAASAYSYSNSTLTLKECKAGTYTATFANSNYVDISATFTVTDYYAYTYMTWAEFYAGETGQTSSALLAAGLDAVSTPTKNAIARFPLISHDIVSTDTTYVNTFTGYVSVDVRMTQNVYDLVKNDSRYTFTSTAPSEYKVVNADGSFGKMVTRSVDAGKSGATVSIATGASARWGHYVLSVSSADIDIGTSGDRIARNYLGALIETSDGKIYGMRHDNNLWSNTDIAFTVNENFVEPHRQGAKRYYEYTSDLEGKTITKITYLLKNLPDVVVDGLNLYVKPLSTATVTTDKAYYTPGSGIMIKFTFNNLPSGVTYDLIALYRVEGRTRIPVTDFTYVNGVLTINENLPRGNYVAVFGNNDNYADISVSIEVENYRFATTDMTWAEFYAGETGETSADLYSAGLDAVSSPTARVANRFSQLTSESNDLGGRDITGVKAVQVRMNEDVYNALSNDTRYTFGSETFTEFKPVNADGSFGSMVTELHTQDGATVSLTTPAVWGTYLFDVESIDVTLGSGDTRYYIGALVETSDGKIYGMRHNNNLWFNAKDIAISTHEFTEVHGVSRRYKYTSDMEGKTVKKITYMLKNLPDEVVSCDVFLKYRTSASVSPVYDEGYHAVMAGENITVTLAFSGVPSSADYKLSGVTFGTGRNRQAVSGCTLSNNVLTINGRTQEGTYTATFSDSNYADISASISVYTTDATDKIISADRNAAGLMFLLTPAGVCDSTDAVLEAQNFVNATDYTSVDANFSENFTGGSNQIEGSGFTFEVLLNNVPSGKRGIVGFSKNLEITPANITQAKYDEISAKVLALPDVAYGWRIPTAEQLRDMGLNVIAVYPDGISRDVTGYISSGLYPGSGSIIFSYGTVIIDRVFTPSEKGKEYALSGEGEATMSDGAYDGILEATWYVSTTPGISPDGSRDVPFTPDEEAIIRNTVMPHSPSFALTESIMSSIRNLFSRLSSKISSTTKVMTLPTAALKGYQSVVSVDSSVIYLPVIEVDEAGIYVFGVSLDKFAVDAPIYWHSNAQDIETGEFISAADDEDAAVFLDDSAEETSRVPANKHVNVAAYFEPGKTYSPTITTTPDHTAGVGSAGGGCNAGITVMMLTAVGIGLAFTRKKHS